MASFPGQNYAPPNVYTRTLYENPLQGAIDNLKVPVFIGEGNEYLSETDLELVRGSSATVDQRIVSEDMTGRAVVSVSAAGLVTLGAFDGVLNQVQVRNLPVVDGSGRGLTTNSRSDVTVTVNSLPVVVASLDGTTGILTLSVSPKLGDTVRVSYFFNRTDTLQTDDLSDQVSALTATVRAATGILDVNAPTPGTATLDLYNDVEGPTGEVIIPANNVLNLIVDGDTVSITLTEKSDYTMQQVANVITAAVENTLTATTFTNNYGESALVLSADHDLTVLEGTANALLGISAGQQSTRTKTFYTFNGPIVDGSNGGVTTTDPSHVVVKVAGVQVIPVSVDGASRAVTLAVAPKAGVAVAVTYWHNTWQDTFDYLAHVSIQSVSRVGDVAGGSQYIQGADFVLEDDKIMWGTAAVVVSGTSTTDYELFDDTQVTMTLIDDRTFLDACTAVVSSQGSVSNTDFLLPYAPTLGNGRDTSLGPSLFQSISNGRIGVPVNRPDVVDVYWGFSVEDALIRGKVDVVKVEGSTVTLMAAVPVGASVYASFYYNRIQDMEYTLTVGTPGQSGVGTYTIQDSGDDYVYTPTFDNSTKSAGLTGITVVFPSGSELTPDLRFEGGSGDDFTGPLEEAVTVTFQDTTDTPAKFTVSGSSPYSFIPGESDLVAITVNGDTVLPASGTDLDNISTGGAGGIMAHFVGSEVVYPDGIDYDVVDFESGAEQLLITFDNDIEVTAPIPALANTTLAVMAASLNEAADGHNGVAGVGSPTTTTFELAAASRSATDDYYVGWYVVVGGTATAITPGSIGEVESYVGSTGVITLTAAIDGANAFVAADSYRIYNPDTAALLKGATKFNGPVDLGLGFLDLDIHHNCTSTAGAGTISGSLAAATYASAAALATALNVAFRGASGSDITVTPAVGSPIALAIVADALLAGLDFIFTADGDGRITMMAQLPGLSAAGFFSFGPQVAAADDFAILAGFDTDAIGGDQTKLNIGEVAKSYTVTLGGIAPHDRLILRNRIHPGQVSISAHNAVEQCKLLIGGGSANDKAGLVTAEYGEAAGGATVRPASMVGHVGFGGGTDTAGEPEVTFYDGTGAQPANNVFEFTLDGWPVKVELEASDTGTVNILGIAAAAGDRIILQIQTALAALTDAPFGNLAAVQSAGLVASDGAAVRITSPTYKEASQVVIGGGSANSLLGFSEGDVAARTLVTAGVLASALNSDRESSQADFMHDFSATNTPAGEFAAQAVALVVEDDVSRKYLHIASAGPATSDYGTGSSITLLDATTRSWLFVGTGIDELDSAASTGEGAINGYYVTSSDADGSGSVNSSILNSGTGQDGKIGQTYRDEVTGLTFTILPRGWHDNTTGPWTAYPAASTIRFDVRQTVTTDANIPVRSIPGIELRVANTTDIAADDTAIVQTFPRGGEEPPIGDIYYASYVYQKQDFNTKFFTKMSSIEAAYGSIHPDNPVALASYLAMINGAVLIGVKQVPRAENSNYADTATYQAAVTELEGVLPGQIKPDMIQPLKGDSTQFFQLLARSNAIQSSIRYQGERTSILGVSSGTTEEAVKTLAQTLGDDRMRVVYPDMALIQIEEQAADGRVATKEHLIDGPMLAAMLAGSVVSPNVDVATPWTRRRLIGPSQLARVLDAVQQNKLAVAGVTVLQDKPPFIQVRHGLTTDMTSILTKTPTVRLIADHVQQRSRVTLDQFIGLKFLPAVLSQVEGRLAKMFQTLVKQQIIAIYTGLRAGVDAEDPTTANVEAYYQPVFPLLYIVLTFHLRSSL